MVLRIKKRIVEDDILVFVLGVIISLGKIEGVRLGEESGVEFSIEYIGFGRFVGFFGLEIGE